MFCKYCGTQNSDNAKFCPTCGEELNPVQAQPVHTPPIQAQPVIVQVPAAPYTPAQPNPGAAYRPTTNGYTTYPPVFNPPQPKLPGKGMAIASMILAIAAITSSLLAYLAIPCAIVSLILGCIANSKAKRVGMKSGMAKAGIIISAIFLGIYVVVLIAVLAFGLSAGSMEEIMYM